MPGNSLIDLVSGVLEKAANIRVRNITVADRDRQIVEVILPPDVVLKISAGGDFPAMPPIIWFESTDSRPTDYLAIPWRSDLAPGDQLSEILANTISGHEPFRRAWAEDARYPLVDDIELGRRAGWNQVATSHPMPGSLDDTAGQRVGAEVADQLRQSTVAIFGLGSVGSYLAEQLARSGIGQITGMDFDIVESHNLTRTVYDFTDVGRSKADALSRRLLAIRQNIRLDLYEADVTKTPSHALRGLFEGADLVIAATDQPQAQSRINSLARASGRPAVFVALYKGAHGGEVVFSVPGLTPCYECATGARRAIEMGDGLDAPRDPTNYGRLAGEVALVADIHHVASVALRVSVSLLAATKKPASGSAAFVTNAMARGHGMAMLGMQPDYSLFPQVMGDAMGQFAFQSVWLNGECHADCPVCGPLADPEFDPFKHDVFGMTDKEREHLLQLVQG